VLTPLVSAPPPLLNTLVDLSNRWSYLANPFTIQFAGDVLAPLVSSLPLELRPTIEAFLANCLAVFDDLDATLLEMNPFTFDSSGMPFPLDIRMVSMHQQEHNTLSGVLPYMFSHV
jgi:hypothetical protein